MRGLFVTFEGGEGSGKTTQIERLAARLRARGADPLLTREPGGSPLAEAIRALLLDPSGASAAPAGSTVPAVDARPGAQAEAFLMVAARADLVRKVIRPALESGRVVICDRYTDSTLAYQGAGRGLPRDLLERLNHEATGGLVPDLTLLFDIDPEAGIARRGPATNRLDREPMAFHLRVRAALLELARSEPGRFVVLDATRPPDALEEAVWSAVETRLDAAR